MKKIAIITIDSLNFGNRLQNYALQEILRNEGFEVETLRRSRDTHKLSKQKFKNIIKRFLKTKHGRFLSFDKKYIVKSKYVAMVNESDEELADKYDYFITGSDQVWNPNWPDLVGRSELLYFALSNQKISYAASFGVNSIPESRKEEYSELLKDFAAISVRENSGAEIVTELIGRDVQVVLDPTLLLKASCWNELEMKPKCMPDGKYILVYMLGPQGEEFKSVVNQYSSSFAYDIFDIGMKDKNGRDLPVGPAEFIYLIHHAEEILTDSFHATAFSVIYHKNIVVFQRNGEDMSDRIRSLASMIGREDRLGDSEIIFSLSDDVNYTEIDMRLNKERENSLRFLRDALSGGGITRK